MKKILRKLKTLYQKFLSRLSKRKIKKIKVFTRDETIDYILKNKCSVARYGDGEVGVVFGRSIGFQDATDDLKKQLKNVKQSKNLLVCIPDLIHEERREVLTEEAKTFWDNHFNVFLYEYSKLFSKNTMMGDTNCTRFYIDRKDKSKTKDYVEKLKKIWEERDVVFVEGAGSRLGVGNELFNNAKSIRRIICPSKNGFEKYDEILDYTSKNFDHDTLFLLALGPTATVLASDLSKLGFQALDVGHIDIEYEWFLMGVETKVPVPSKHVNECNSDAEDISQKKIKEKYEKEIIYKIG